MLPPCPLTARRFSKPWWTSESQTSRNTCRKVVVESRIEPGNCMWYQESVTFSVGATSTLSPSVSASSAARTARERAMKQSVSSGMWGPCCSVVPIGVSTASAPSVLPSSTCCQVSRSIRCCAIRRSSPNVRHHAILARRREGRDVEGQAEVNGVKLWYDVTGDGEPVVQIHGAGFGHFNFAPATAELAKHFKVVDYDMRGYGQSDRPDQHYDMEVWADDVAGLMDALGIEAAHVHGTSMGGMIAIVFAGKYPTRTTSVVINCAAAKLGTAGRLIFKNWIDIARLDVDGPGSRILAELIAWQALSKAFLETPEGVAAIDTIQQILRDSNRIEVFTAACQAMCDMDLTAWLPRVTSPALVLGGDEDLMTPWDQGPNGAGQQAIYEGIPNAEQHGIRGSYKSKIFDDSEEHYRLVIDFFQRHSAR